MRTGKEACDQDCPQQPMRAALRLSESSILPGRNRWKKPIATGEDAFIKFGVGVTAGSPVTLDVPRSARSMYALHDGSNASSVADGETEVHGSPCPRSQGKRTEWVGGYLVEHPACVPLVVHVGGRSTRVSLALGRRC
jgi:cell wall assembly regulator SMI1